MNAWKKEEVLKEMKECFENEGISEIRKAYYFLGLMIVLFDRRTIVLINIAIALGIGFGLNAVQPTPGIILISLIVNLLVVKFILFGRLLKGVDEDLEEFRIQYTYIKELMKSKKQK
jgi:hypothetical protein